MRLLLVFVLFLVCLVSASAVDYHVFVNPTEQSVYMRGNVTFSLELQSSLPREQPFEIISEDVNWGVSTKDVLLVPPRGNLTTQLVVSPRQVGPGTYILPLVFRAIGGGATVRKILRMRVVDEPPLPESYVPAVRGVVHMDPEVDPRFPVALELVLQNQNKKELDKVEIKVRSGTLNGDFEASLKPLEEKVLKYELLADEKTPPMKDALSVVLIVPEPDKSYRFDLLSTPFKIIAYGDIAENVEEQAGFLKRTIVISLANEGNAPSMHVVNLPVGLNRFFMSTSLPGEKVGDNVRWDLDLGAGESVDIFVTFNYLPAFFILFIVFCAVLSYVYFRSPLVVKKKATVVSSKEGVKDLKVVIELRNRGLRPVNHISVIDLVPEMAVVRTDHTAHLLPPTKVVPHTHKGTLVKWEIDIIEPKEQRILTYHARCKLTVLGGLALPVAAVKFVVNQKHRKTVSNRPVITL